MWRESSFFTVGSVVDMGIWKLPLGKAMTLYQKPLWRDAWSTLRAASGWLMLTSSGVMRTKWHWEVPSQRHAPCLILRGYVIEMACERNGKREGK
ncbi:hypothetical protein B0T14DRAFT_340328 [Immersiella caudata]|uniref:Uncharacterized protein n=1 Tax=Immersiella caudata TaxID=314043 RepID=A0AA39WCY0_9PEZI|nr:hypothetical protein B0T14DRAFT_340328 [Immersiella caudata]